MKICNFEIGLDKPLFIIAGPCVIESEKLVMDTALHLKEVTQKLNINFIFKSSFEKANRSSSKSFFGLGIDKGLEILAKVKNEIKVPVVTDVHEDTDFDKVAKVVDVLQTPAFLCRQTNYIKKVIGFSALVTLKYFWQISIIIQTKDN